MLDAARLAVGTMTVFPVRAPARVDGTTWRAAILGAPLVGVVVGATAWLVAWALGELSGSPLVSAVAVVVTVALKTRGLHLDDRGIAQRLAGLHAAVGPLQKR